MKKITTLVAGAALALQGTTAAAEVVTATISAIVDSVFYNTNVNPPLNPTTPGTTFQITATYDNEFPPELGFDLNAEINFDLASSHGLAPRTITPLGFDNFICEPCSFFAGRTTELLQEPYWLQNIVGPPLQAEGYPEPEAEIFVHRTRPDAVLSIGWPFGVLYGGGIVPPGIGGLDDRTQAFIQFFAEDVPSSGDPEKYYSEWVWFSVTNITITPGGPPSAPALSCIGFDAPLDSGPVRVKKNRALPLKAVLQDEFGNDIFDVVPPILQVTFTNGGTQAQDVSDEALSAGAGTEGNQFEYIDGQWRFNLKTKNYTAPGNYEVSMLSGDTSVYVMGNECVANFVID